MNCNNCIHLNITESEQKNTSDPHICTLYNKHVFHLSQSPEEFHGMIYPCKECDDAMYEKFEHRFERGLRAKSGMFYDDFCDLKGDLKCSKK